MINNSKNNNITIENIKESFPYWFKSNGDVNIEAIHKELGNPDLSQESYYLNWLGKTYARVITSIDTETIIIPNIEHNNKKDNSKAENIYLTGDNLEVLKHLTKSYGESIRTIYIDPPYNTGQDNFVYSDNFKFTPEELSNLANIEIEEARKILDFTKKSSNSHSAWLTFMYPRLFIARELLSKNGVIFISIDDNEQANLKLLCDEIFGEENFVSQIVIQSNKRGQTYNEIAKTHEYVLVYTKHPDGVINEIKKEIDGFKYEDTVSEFSIRELRNRNPKFGRFNRPNLYYPIYVDPSNFDKDGFCSVSLTKDENYSIEVYPLNSIAEESCWRWGTLKTDKNIDKDTLKSNLVAKKKKSGQYGIYEKYRKTTMKAKTIWFEDEVINPDGDIWDEKEVISEQGSLELSKLDMKGLFDFPKPTYLIKKLLEIGSDDNSIVLDFFSGSATTAQSVLELNSELESNRKFICVQLPEDINEKYNKASKSDKKYYLDLINFLDGIQKPHELSEIGIERIKRVINQLKGNTEKNAQNLGFKIFNVVPTDEKIGTNNLNKMMEFNGQIISDNYLIKEIGEDAILATWMLEDGHKLSTIIEEYYFNNYKAYKINETLYLLDGNFDIKENLKILIQKIENEKEFNINKIVIFGYSFSTSTIASLIENMKHMKYGRKAADIIVEVRL